VLGGIARRCDANFNPLGDPRNPGTHIVPFPSEPSGFTGLLLYEFKPRLWPLLRPATEQVRFVLRSQYCRFADFLGTHIVVGRFCQLVELTAASSSTARFGDYGEILGFGRKQPCRPQPLTRLSPISGRSPFTHVLSGEFSLEHRLHHQGCPPP